MTNVDVDIAEVQDSQNLGIVDRLKDWVIYPLIGSALIGFFACMDCYLGGDFERITISIALSFVFWNILAHGNSALSNWLDSRVSWLNDPLKRLVLGVVILLLYTIGAILIVYFIFIEFYLERNFLEVFSETWLPYMKFPLIITFFIALFLHGRHFLISWRQAAINVEKLRNQNLSSQFESLKNQVNPHFLFNSLNALSSLVYKDQDKAVAFIRKLSEVYRYVLDNQLEEVVKLEDELEFLRSYVFLNKIRFGDNLNVDIQNMEKPSGAHMLPPLSLQMLVENAIKHNVISRENRLEVHVKKEDDYLVVWNNLNEKRSVDRPSGVGLNNIESRYKFLTEKPVFVKKEDQVFTVKIPLLQLQN